MFKKIIRTMPIMITLLFIDTVYSIAGSDITDKTIIKNLGGSGIDYVMSTIESSDGGEVSVGTSFSRDAGFENKGGADAVILKYNNKNELEWQRNFGGIYSDYYTSVIETKDGGFVCVGYSGSSDAGFQNNGSTDGIIVKYDKNGNQLWVKSYGYEGTEEFNSVIELNDGDLVVAGVSDSRYGDFQNKGGKTAIILKFDNSGNKLWTKTVDGYRDEAFTSLVKTSDGQIVVAGYSSSFDAGFNNRGDFDGIIVKYDEYGNQKWIKNFGYLNSDKFYSVIEAQNGDLICAGESYPETQWGGNNYTNCDAIVVRFTNEGDRKWEKYFGGSRTDSFTSVVEENNGNITAVGYSESVDAGFTNRGYEDAIIVQYTSDGDYNWVKNFGGLSSDKFHSVIQTTTGDLVANGETSSSYIHFNNNGMTDMLVVRYNELADLIFDKIEELENGQLPGGKDEILDLIDSLPNGIMKDFLESKVEKFPSSTNTSANIDVYIQFENVLSLSLNTNKITFTDYSGVESIEKTEALILGVDSTLPYNINVYLPQDIQNADKTSMLDRDSLGVKESSESNYNHFLRLNEKIMLKGNNPPGEKVKHGIDLKLNGGKTYKTDVYKTVLKFEIEQV